MLAGVLGSGVKPQCSLSEEGIQQGFYSQYKVLRAFEFIDLNVKLLEAFLVFIVKTMPK